MTKKEILIILVSALLVIGGCIIYYWYFQVPKEPKYSLTLRVKNWANMKPVESLPIEVLRTDTGESVVAKKTDTEGVVTFILPAGNYSCRVESKVGWTGGIDINLENDIEQELKVLSVYR